MSLILKRIELSNIRSHKYVKFEPSEEGITALSGPNGSGKSTIFDSMAWTLYGTKPQGVKKNIAFLRNGTDLGNESCYARCVFLIDDDTLFKVERRIVNKTGSVECEVWEKRRGEDDYRQTAGPSVSHAEPYIKKRLKMDEKGFLAAVLVQQKQVDQLISAGPKERAEVIEKLTGISSITLALQEARQEYNSLKKTLQNYTLDPKEVEALKKEKEKIEKELKEKNKKGSDNKKVYDSLNEEYAQLHEKVAEQEKLYNLNERYTQELSFNEEKLADLEEEFKRTNQLKEDKKKSLDTFSLGEDFESFKREYNAKKNDLKSKNNIHAQHILTRQQLNNDIENNNSIIKDSEIDDVKNITKLLQQCENNIEKQSKSLENIKKDDNGLQAENRNINNAIKTLTSSNGHCPTCLQTVDDVTDAVEALKEKINSNEQKSNEYKEEINKIRESINDEEELQDRLLMCKNAVQENEENKTKILDIERLIKEEEGLLKVLEKEMDVLDNKFNNAKHSEQMKNEYNTLLKMAMQSSDNIERVKGIIQDRKNKIKNNKAPTLKTLETSQNKLNTVLENKNNIRITMVEIKGDCQQLKQLLDFNNEKIVKAERELNNYQELMSSVEKSGACVKLLEEFRENRIKNSIPVVSAYASDILNRFTDGRFTQLSLDKNFNTTVTKSNGTEYAVGLLSGGELSAAAISLRLAISMLLNSGNSKTMLGLDEVLVSQDAERSEQILTAIKDLFEGQLIFISHGSNTNEIADKVIELN